MNSKLKISLTLISGALLLLFSAYINGFPIVYSDTSTYLASGFELKAPFDRPIMYGLFLRLSSLNGISLWSTIFCQGLIVSFLVFKLLRTFVPNLKNINITFISIITLISLLTSVSWTSSQLFADIFTSILILSLIILVIGQSKKWVQILVYAIFFFATATHISHVSFNLLLILTILIVRQLKFLKIKEYIKLRPLVISFFLTLLSISTMGSALSKSKHGFLMGALVEHGIAKKYLDENCEDSNYKFCAYKDSLPDKGWKFLWEEDSPFYKMGGWKGTKKEFNEIIFNTLTSRKYILLHIKESLKATTDQLTKFKIGDGNGSFLEGTLLHKRINTHFEHESLRYQSSLQSNENLNFLGWYNTVLFSVVIISIVVLLLVIIQIRNQDRKLLSVILIVIIGIMINSWTCGTLANAIDRLGTKVIWLIPLMSLIGIMNICNKNTIANNTYKQ